MKNSYGPTTLLISLLLLALVTSVTAAVPQLINYQGRLTNSIGAPLDTTVALIFQIYADSNGVTSLWDETHPSVTITDGLFQVLLGSVSPIAQNVFTGEKRWLGVRLSGGSATTLIPIVSAAYAYRSNASDTASLAKTVSDNAITSAKIQNGTIQFADIGQNSATAGEVIKWNGSAWEAQADATASNTSGWTDNGNIVSLSTPTDTVALNTTSRLGKLNVNGDVGLTGTSNIKFGSDANRITATGLDMRLVAEDLSMLTTEDITFGHYGDETWIKFDNTNKRVGIGTTTVDDRLHVENDNANTPCWLKIETSHATNWSQAGLRIKTPQNMWNLRMDTYANANFPSGALSLYSQDGAKEAMTWLEDGNVGVGTTSPTKKLHVYGSALVKDTLYAGAINPSLMSASRLPDEPGVAGSVGGTKYLTGDWLTLDSVTIDAPGPGYVLALATTSFYTDHTYGDYIHILFGISNDTASPSVAYHWQFDNNLPSGQYDGPGSCHRLFSVPSAGEYRYYFLAIQSYTGEDVVRAEYHALTAVYFPTSYESGKGSASIPQVMSRTDASANQTASQVVENTGHSEITSELRFLRAELETLKKRMDEPKK
jgi:hypothetical protein